MSFVRDFIRRNLKLENDVVFYHIRPQGGSLFLNSSRQKNARKYDLFSIYSDYSTLPKTFSDYCLSNGGKAYFYVTDYDWRRIDPEFHNTIMEFDLNYRDNNKILWNNGNRPKKYTTLVLKNHKGRDVILDVQESIMFNKEVKYLFPQNVIFMENYRGTVRDSSFIEKFPVCDLVGNVLHDGDVVLSKDFSVYLIEHIDALSIQYKHFQALPGGEITLITSKPSYIMKNVTERSEEDIIKIGSRKHYCVTSFIKAPEHFMSKVLEWKLSL